MGQDRFSFVLFFPFPNQRSTEAKRCRHCKVGSEEQSKYNDMKSDDAENNADKESERVRRQ